MSTENQTAPQSRFAAMGDWFKKNQADVAIVIGFVLVAAISFGAGFLAAPGPQKSLMTIEGPVADISQQVPVKSTTSITGQGASGDAVNLPAAATGQEQGTFVASKSGTKYYWPWSPYAKRIKEENKVWFNTESEAQRAGYGKSADFDSLSPAGYVMR